MAADQITFRERIVAGVLSALMMAIMTIFVPIGVVIYSRGHGLILLAMFGSFHIWGLSLIVVAGMTGAGLGADRATLVFAHLWGTETPRRLGVTLALWLALIAIGLVSYWMFSAHHPF